MSRLFGNTRGVVVNPRPPAAAASDSGSGSGASKGVGFFDKLKNTVKEAKRSLQETFDGKPIELDAQYFFAQTEFADFEKAITQLKKHVDEYMKALKVLTASQFHIASDLLYFYDKTHEHRSVGEEFLAAHSAFHSGECNAAVERVREEVVKPIDTLLAEFPAVKELMEKRKSALADLNDAKREADHQRRKPNVQNSVKSVLKLGHAEEQEKTHETAFNDVNDACLAVFDHYAAARGPTIDRHFTSLYAVQTQFFASGMAMCSRLDSKMASVAVASRLSRATISAPPPSFLSRDTIVRDAANPNAHAKAHGSKASEHDDAVARGLTPHAQLLLDRYRARPVAAHPPPATPIAPVASAKKFYPNQTFSSRKTFAELHYSFNPFPSSAPSAHKPPPPPPPVPSAKPKAPAAPATVPIYKPPPPAAASAAAAAAMVTTPPAAFSAFPPVSPSAAAAAAAAAASPPPPPATVGGAVKRPVPVPANRPAPPPPSGAAKAASPVAAVPGPPAPRPSAMFGVAGASGGGGGGGVAGSPVAAAATTPTVIVTAKASPVSPASAGGLLPPTRPNRAPTALKNAVRRVVATGAAAAASPAPARAAVVHHTPPAAAAAAAVAATALHTPPSVAAAPIASSPARHPPASPAAGAAASPLAAVGEDAPLDTGAAVGVGAGEDSPSAVPDAVDGELGGSLSHGRSRANGALIARAEAAASVSSQHSQIAQPHTYVTAIYDYAAQRAVELSFSAGDRLWVVERDADSGWWQGLTAAYESGYFPSNYTDMNEQPTEGS